MMVAQAIPSLALFGLSFMVPESPSWLVRRGRVEEVRRVLSRSSNPEEVRLMLEELASDNRAQATSVPLLAYGARVVLVGVSLSLLQQLLGPNAISYYGPQILQRMGLHMDASFLGVLAARCVNLLATMVVVLIIDRVGRKPLLIFGALTMGISMVALGALFRAENTGVLGLVAMCCYMAGFGISFGPVIWILMWEIFPASIRVQAMSLAIAAQWVANFLVSFTFPIMFGDAALNTFAHGGFAFFLYGSFGVLAAFVVMRFVPETRGVDNGRIGLFWGSRQAGQLPSLGFGLSKSESQ
jgi:SP family xylose:H+ symportor-like MFS transporter